MKVLIALVSSSRQLSGVQRHAVNLARCLLTCAEITDVHLVVAPWQLQLVQEMVSGDDRLHVHSAETGASILGRNLWFYRALPKLAIRLAVDLVHLAYPVPVRRAAFRCPVVVTLHDLYPYDIPENFGFPRVYFNRFILRHCLQSVDTIACVSRSTLDRLEKLRPNLAHSKSVVIYNSVEKPLVAEIKTPQWGNRPFLLCVAQHRRNKNIVFAVNVFASLLRSGMLPAHMRLLVVGIPGPETPSIMKRIKAVGLIGSVVLLKGISDASLQWCYDNASFLLAPSSIEGFGLPVAEALLAGCRIVCSDIPAFREVGGQHCHYVALDNGAEDAFAGTIMRTMHLPSPGPVDLPHLSTRSIGREYLRLYQSLLGTREQSGSQAIASFAAAESEPLP